MTPAIKTLQALAIDHRILHYEIDPTAADDEHNLGMAAARAMGLDSAQVFKTLVAELDAGQLACAVLPVDRTLRLKSLARAAAVKSAKLADRSAAERATGYVTGGISPFGHRQSIPIYLARQALDFDVIYVSAGKRGLELAVATGDMISCCAAEVCDLVSQSD